MSGGVLNALYVRGDLDRVAERGGLDPADLVGRTGEAFVALEVDASSDFEDDPDLSEASTTFGEAIRLQLTAFGTDDVLRYDHWRAGRLARRLHLAPNVWTAVEGVPEPWEERALLGSPQRGASATLDTRGVLAALIKHVGLPAIWPR
ncbi:MAG: hypothetical protein M9894_01060 [Planctomycetes bacterium]|nr:hypothetical protein [Planctomycetota bacterium]